MWSTGDGACSPQGQFRSFIGEGGGEQISGADVHAHARHERGGRASAQSCVQLTATRQRQVDLNWQPVEWY